MQVYPPPTPNCNANPPPNTPPGTPGVRPTPGQPGQPGAPGAPGHPGGRLPRTGAEPVIALWAGTALIVTGTGLRRLARRVERLRRQA